MKRLLVGALVAALCSVPGISRADTRSAPRDVAAPTARDAQARPAHEASSEDEASEYAEREKAAPQQLEEFSGGADGVYISAGALAAALLVVLLIVAL